MIDRLIEKIETAIKQCSESRCSRCPYETSSRLCHDAMMDDYRQLLELIKQERTKAPKPEQTTESNKGVSADRPLIEALAADIDDVKYKQTVLEEEIEKIKKRLESTVTLKLHYEEE